MCAHTKNHHENITPKIALDYLKQGNERFLHNSQFEKNLLKQLKDAAEEQFPFATILSCIDSRTSSELIFDQGLGDIFSIRISGNILNEDILGSMEFSCKESYSKLIVVLGHTRCGAIISACNNLELGHFSGLLKKLEPAISEEKETLKDRNGQNISFVNNVSTENVRLIIKEIKGCSKILSELESTGQINIIGALHDIETGEVTFFEN